MQSCNDIIELAAVISLSLVVNTNLARSFSERVSIQSCKAVGGKQCECCFIGETARAQWTEKTLALFAAHYITHHTWLVQGARGLSSHS